MTADELEFSISRYADGDLSDGQRSAVEDRLATDPAARAVLADYRRLGDLLAAPPAGLDWDALAGRLSSAVAEGDAPAVAGRIGFAGWAWRAGSLAAAVAVAVTVGRTLHRAPTVAMPTPAAVPVGPAVAEVSGPSVEVGSGPVVAQVTVGPSPALAARTSSWRYGEGVVSRPATVVIASASSR